MKYIYSSLIVLFSFFANSQSIYEWYQDGIVVFQLNTKIDYKIESVQKLVDMEKVPFIAENIEEFGIYEMTQLHPNDKDILLNHTYQIKFDHWSKVDELIKKISQDFRVEYAEKKELHVNFLTPNDLGANSSTGTGMWHLYTMNAQQAWDLSTGDPNVIVAVTDNAILSTHEDLQNKFVQGYDAPTGGTNTNPCGTNDGNHGTHVSGTVGAETNNSIGVSSIGYNVSVMPIKIGDCSGALTHGYEGINYAANNGADVINMSWGGGGSSTYAQNVCNAAYNAGAILVAAAGNDGTNQQFYPAAYNNVISVASTTTNDAKSSFSQYGTWVDIAAPGSAIRSTYATANNGYARIQGTSMASPNVAGLVGLIKSYVPSATNQDIIDCLLNSADNIDAVNPSYIGQLGAGRINAYEALLCIGLFNVALDAGITEIINPESTVCGNSFEPQVRLRNFGTDELNSVTINYEWNGTPGNFIWTGTLLQGQSEIVTLPNQVAPNGNYTFTASTNNPNSGTDLNPGNDETFTDFVVDENGQFVNLNLDLDCYGSEISWTITDDNGTALVSGGGYSDNANGESVIESFCLPVGCYSFEIEDSYGDGMYGSQWQTCSIDGSYNLIDQNSNTLVQMTAPNGDFGFGTSHNFCVVAPNNMNDAGITEIISPVGVACSNDISPEVVLKNFGNNALNTVNINYQTTGGIQTFNWVGNLTTGQTEIVNLPLITSNNGNTLLTIYTSDPNGLVDDDSSNDQEATQINVHSAPVVIPFQEDFESNDFSTGNWTLVNIDNDVTWELAQVGGITPGTTAAKIDFYNYATAAQRDELISPLISLVGYVSAEMTFDHAYRRFNQNAADSLVIYVSSSCGESWDVVFAAAEDGTGSFATQTTNTTNFVPAIADDWCFSGGIGASCFSVDLSAFVGQEVFVKFESYNAGTIGNNLYLDNININGVPSSEPPTPNFSTNGNEICEGGIVDFTDLSTANITDWSWTFPGGSPASSTDQNPSVTYSTSGNYDVTLTVTNSFGTETLTMSQIISVNSLPILSITQSASEICEGQSVTMTANGALSYNWDNGLGQGATKIVTPMTTTVYSVTGSNGLACDATESVTITVVENPVVLISSTSDSICLGDMVELIATGATTYVWNNGLGSGNIQQIYPNQTTIYTVTGTSGSNCSSSATTTVFVSETPVVEVNPVSVSVCEGASVTLSASGADNFTWSPSVDLNSSTGSSVIANPTTSSIITVEGSNNCGVDSGEITIFVNPVPSVPIINQNGNNLEITLLAGETAIWYLNGSVVGNGPVITMLESGNYEVVVSNEFDCTNSANGDFQVDTTSLSEIDELNNFSIYPNPTSGLIYFDFKTEGQKQIKIIDALGKEIYNQNLHCVDIHSSISINMNHAESGLYTILINESNKLHALKITIIN